MIKRMSILALLAANLAVWAGCGSSEGNNHNEPGINVSPRFVDSVIAEGLSFPALLTRDHRITFDEYESATFAFLGCAHSKGALLSSQPELSTRLRYYYALETQNQTAGEALRDCRKRYLDAVEFVWADYMPPTPGEIDSASQLMRECLDPAFPSPQTDSSARRERERACLRQVFDRFGIPDYYPWGAGTGG